MFRSAFYATLFFLLSFAAANFATAQTNIFPKYKHPVMTWVPPYAVGRCQTRLNESFDGTGMKDALTHLGLQFWQPTKDGAVGMQAGPMR